MQYSRFRGLVLELNGNQKVFFSERDAKITKFDLSYNIICLYTATNGYYSIHY